jgi:glucose-6-phosphate dehydrogenase assembly protein OpcA
MGSSIAPERILHELANLWVDLAKEDSAKGSTGVLRAVTLTLIVLAEESDDAVAIGETLATLMPEHPARAIVVRVRPGGERSLQSRVFAQCWTPFGQRRHICCEQVGIETSEASLAEVPSVILPLAVPDLPVVLWCRSAGLAAHPAFGEMAALAGKIILDGALFPDAAAALRHMQKTVDAGRALGDLSWTRMTPWRELIARVFDNRDCLANLSQVSRVQVKYPSTQGGPSVAALYLAAWLRAGIEAAGSRPDLRLEPGSEMRVEIAAGGLSFSLSQSEGQCAEVRINDIVSRTRLRTASECELLREELSIPGRDPVFEKTLADAVRLALSS